MKNFTILLFLFCSFQLSAQQDTVFVDHNDSVYTTLPNGYAIVDTVEEISQKSSFISGGVGCGGSSGTRIYNLPDSIFYIFWKLEVKNSGLQGAYYFSHDGLLLDSISLDSASPSIQFTDTFKIISDTLKMQYTCNVVGNDTVSISSTSYFTRIEINIVPISSGLHKAKLKNDEIFIYPNPATQEIKLSGIELENGELIQIFDGTGKLIKSTYNKGEEIDIKQLAKGIYFLRVKESKMLFIKE